MPDSFRYLQLADSLKNGEFGLTTSRGFEYESLRLPGYPFFILVCQTLFGSSPYAIVFVQMFLYLLCIWMIYKVVDENFGEGAGIVFLILPLVLPVVAFSSVYVLPDTVSMLLISAGVFFIGKKDLRRHLPSFAVAGICFGLAAYLRSNLFPAGVVAALAIFIGFPKLRKPALLMTMVIFLTIMPWLVRNYMVFGEVSGSSANVGFETILYQSSLSAKMSEQNKSLFKGNVLPDKYEDYDNEQVRGQISFLKKESGLTEMDEYHSIVFDISPKNIPTVKMLLRQKAFENISAAPLYFTTQAIANAIRMWIAGASIYPKRFPVLPNFLTLLGGVFVLLCGIGNCILVLRSTDENVRFLGIICFSILCFFTISLCFLYLEIRYSVPAKLLLYASAANLISSFCRLGLTYRTRYKVVAY